MPFGDWQFWVVTGVAGLGFVALVRTVLPRKRASSRKKKVQLTVEQRKVR